MAEHEFLEILKTLDIAGAPFNYEHLLCGQRSYPERPPRVMAARQSGLVARRANARQIYRPTFDLQSNDGPTDKLHI